MVGGVVLHAVDHAGLQGGVDLAEGHRGRGGAHQAHRLGDGRVGQAPDLAASEAGRIGEVELGDEVARADVAPPDRELDARLLA
jgi:hypothetical protein